MAPNQGGTPGAPRGCPLRRCRFPGSPVPRSRRTPRLPPPEPTRVRISPVDYAAARRGHRGTVCSADALRAGSDRHGQWRLPRAVGRKSVRPTVLTSSRTEVAAARDPHPPGGRDRRDKDRDGPSGFGSMATLRRFVRDGDQVAEHHGRRGRCRPRFALTATPGSPTSRPPLPAPHWPDLRCPARRLRVGHQGGVREAPAASFQPSRERRGGVAVHQRWPGLIPGAAPAPANHA